MFFKFINKCQKGILRCDPPNFSNSLFPWYSISFNCSSFVHSIFFNLFKSSSFLSSFSNPQLKTLPNGGYSDWAYSTTPGLYLKSLPVKYSYLSNSLDDNAEMWAASLSK